MEDLQFTCSWALATGTQVQFNVLRKDIITFLSITASNFVDKKTKLHVLNSS